MLVKPVKKPNAKAKMAPKVTTAKTKTAAKRQTVKGAKSPFGTKVAGTSALTDRARQMMEMGLAASNRMQGEALRVYGLIAAETQKLASMTTDAASGVAKLASQMTAGGKPSPSKVAALAQERAAAVAQEIKAFAKRSEALLRQNAGKVVQGTANNTRQTMTQLEEVFQARIAKTLNTFGIPSRQDVKELQQRMAELQKALILLNKRRTNA